MIVVGVDAGATKTSVMVMDLNRKKIVSRTRGGPANPASIGWDMAIKTIIDTIKSALFNVEECPKIIALSVAYTGWGRYLSKYREALLEVFPDAEITVLPDDIAVLVTCYPGGEGLACIMGTGSHCVGVYNGKTARVGGWGHLLNDELGAYRIGRDAIVEILKSLDGRSKTRSVLYDLFLQYMGVSNIYDAIDKIYSNPSLSKTIIAGFAKEVLKAARNNDPIAIRILENLSRDFREHIIALINRLSIKDTSINVCICGGLFRGAKDVLIKYLAKSVNEGIRISIIEPKMCVECGVIVYSLKNVLEYDLRDILNSIPKECYCI